jgi:hypothetical protein
MVTVDQKVRISHKIVDQLANRAVGKLDDQTALGAYEMVPVTRLPHDVGRESAGLQQAPEHVYRGQDLQCAVHRSPADVWQQRNDLLGREWPVLVENRDHDAPSRLGGPIAVGIQFAEHRFECGGRQPVGRKDVHTAELTIL